jgi:TatD DNase family protein
MFDTHCHLTSREYAIAPGNIDRILTEAHEAGVYGAITVATTSSDCLAARDLATKHPNIWFSAGVHPLHSDEPINWNDVASAAGDPRCVAWGELGLDNHYDRPLRKVQDKVLADELALIESKRPSIDKPIIVHCRDAFDELLSIFRAAPFDPSRYVFHCFTGGPDDARQVLDFGAWISFTGIVTFQNAPQVAQAAKLVPLDRMMVETDAPFLTPEPMRKVRPNEPKFVVHTARRLAELRGMQYAEMERQLDQNAEKFFGIPVSHLMNSS